MNTQLRIMCTGKITRGIIDWTFPPLPQVPQLGSDDPDASFDAPAFNGFSYFEHLMPDGALQATIDYGAEVQDLIDGRDDEDYWRQGNW